MKRLLTVVLLTACACTGIATSDRMLMSSASGLYYYTDWADITGCASDSNTCTSAVCGDVGVGPCQSVNGVIAQWGTFSPIVSHTITIQALSSEPAGAEDIVLRPILEGADLILIGSPTMVGAPFSAGAVTPKLRTSHGTQLKVAAFPSSAVVGMSVHNLTTGSVAMIDALSLGVATLTQPLNGTALTTVTSAPSVTEDDAWAPGQSLQLESLTTLNLKELSPTGGDDDPSGHTPVAWVQDIYVPDAYGTPGKSILLSNAYGVVTAFADCRIDPEFDTSGEPHPYSLVLGSQLNGGALLGLTDVLGGSSNGALAQTTKMYDLSVVDDDVALHGETLVKGLYSIAGYAFVDGLIEPSHGGILVLEHDWASGSNLYGPGTLAVQSPDSAVENQTGGTWVAGLNMSSLTMSGQYTGTAYVSGSFVDGVAITSPNLDRYGGLENVATGTRYTY